MTENENQKPFSKTLPPILLSNKHIRNICEDGAVCDHASKAKLFVIRQQAKTERICDRCFELLVRASDSPIGIFENVVQPVEIYLFTIGR